MYLSKSFLSIASFIACPNFFTLLSLLERKPPNN
nr:MAG TPA: hypothetical protein [Caudoviricetes sp.]